MALVTSNQVTAAMQNYLEQQSSDLLMLAYESMDVMNDVTFYPDVKTTLVLSTFEIDDIVKPFTSTFSPTANAFRFVPRELSVKVGKAELEIFPEAYRNTYLAQFMGKGVTRNPEDLPFEQYMWEGIFGKFGEQLNNTTAYSGVYNAAGAGAADVADGYGTILAALITAGSVVPTGLGAITSANATTKMKQLWRTTPEKFRQPGWEWTMYMSSTNYEAYEDSQETMGYFTGRGDDMLRPKYLRGSNNLCMLKPVSWMGGSSRLILTPKKNIVMGADAITGDLAKANIIPQMWGFDIGIAAALGFNFRYPGLIKCNELV